MKANARSERDRSSSTTSTPRSARPARRTATAWCCWSPSRRRSPCWSRPSARSPPLTRFVTIDTGVLFPETLGTWRAFEERFGVDIEVEDARGDWTGRTLLLRRAKVEALERALAGADAWVTGIRREQSPTRADAEKVEHDAKRGIAKYNPLAHWTEQGPLARDRGQGPAVQRAARPGLRLDRLHALHAPGKGREGRWAGTDKLECGIHVVPARPAAA